MSYQDPYGHHVAGASTQYQPQVVGASQEYYNPYNPSGQQYTDESQNQAAVYPPPQRAPTSSSGRSKPSVSVVPVRRESSGFEQGEFEPGPKGAAGRNLLIYLYPRSRYDPQGNLCTKGGPLRCFGRICCCSLMTTVFLLVSIVLALALWIRPPSITIGSVQTMLGPTGNAIQTTNDGITVNMGVGISVANPNYFSVDFKKIEAEIFYPINNTPVGGGSSTNIVFNSHSQTNFTFNFNLTYNSTQDPTGAVISDLATKCGALGGTKSNLDISYKITLGIRILLVTISPVISNQFNFPCPISASDIDKFLGGKTG
ncbi:hypothetical protein BYT27DRAFT_7124302 [Phlegmacium glaucopus]|nr:hypothetical protein BYT27DRAFT_7124302 [Phlegmacium glaucopus]